jgi:hypothetical protein
MLWGRILSYVGTIEATMPHPGQLNMYIIYCFNRLFE